MSSDTAETWRLLRSDPAAAAFNMAADEALLAGAPEFAAPVLRFYAWNEPAASFGYFQKHAEIAAATLLRPLVRRPTGGGLVPHDADWTYSLTVPPAHSWYALHAVASYERMHRWIQKAFARLGLVAELAACCRKKIPGQCFAGYEKHDVLLHGRKIAGAAQRRTKSGLLIQGSVQPPPRGIERSSWENALCETATEEWRVQWDGFKTPAIFSRQVQLLMDQKYSRPEYNRSR